MKKCTLCISVLFFVVTLTVIDSGITQDKNVPKGFAFYNPKEFKNYHNLHGGAGTIKYSEGFSNDDFKTNFHFFRIGVIPPKSSIGEYRAVDSAELFIIMDGLVYVTVNGNTGRVLGGSLVPCRMGESIGIYNPTEWEVTFAWIAATEKKGIYNPVDLGNNLTNKSGVIPCPFTWIPIDYGNYRSYATSPAHEGKGLLFNTICTTGSYLFPLMRAQTIGIAPGTSIGYHQHGYYEELYFMVSGKAQGTVNDVTMDLKVGDCIMNPRGGAHGIYNNSNEDALIIFSRTMVSGKDFEFVNFGDDLSNRKSAKF